MSRLLNALGLMTRAEHERIVVDNEDHAYKAWSTMANERDRMSASRTELMHTIAEMQVKFKTAITDIEKQVAENAQLKIRLHYAEPRAKKWDDSLKRSRDRKEAKKGNGRG